MKPNFFSLLRGPALRAQMVLLLVLSLLLQPLLSAPPVWWQDRGLLLAPAAADDFAALNQGQLKNFVRAAVYELHDKLPTGAGQMLNQLLNTWRTQKLNSDDYAAVTVGQLKAVAMPVYEAMESAGLSLPLPWTSLATDDDDYAVANLGQAKAVFAFVLPAYHTMGLSDSDGDGFSDALEQASGTDPSSASSVPSRAAKDMPGAVGDGLPPYVDPYPEPWPDFSTPSPGSDPTTDSDEDEVPDLQDAVPYDDNFTHPRTGVPHYNIIDLGPCKGGFYDMADNGALLWKLNSSTSDKYYKRWLPSQADKPKEFEWKVGTVGPANCNSIEPPHGITEEGQIFSWAHKHVSGNTDGMDIPFKYDPQVPSSSWLPPIYPQLGNFQDSYATGLITAIAGNQLYGEAKYVIQYNNPSGDPDITTWVSFFNLSTAGVSIEKEALMELLPPFPPGYPYPNEVITLPPAKYEIREIGASSGTGVVRWRTHMKRRVTAEDFFGVWYRGIHEYLEKTYVADLVTETGDHPLKTIDLPVGETAPPWSYPFVSPAAEPWLIAEQKTGGSSKNYICKPTDQGSDYQSFPIYAGLQNYTAQTPISNIVLITAQGQAVVYGEFDPDSAGQEYGLWADGDVRPMSKVISGYDRYTTWKFPDVTREGMIAATAMVGTEKRMLLLIPMTFREILADGSIAPVGGGVQASMPSPVFDMQCALQNPRVLTDGSVVGDLQVSGSLTSKACDNIKGDLGTVTEVKLWVNGAETVQSTFAVQVSKPDSGTRARPYPFTGTFNTTITNVPLTAGNNTFKFTASDPVYHIPGYSLWSATVNVSHPEEADPDGPSGTMHLGMQLPAATLASGSIDTLTATVQISGAPPSQATLTESSPASGVFTGTLGEGDVPIRLTLPSTSDLSATEVSRLSAHVLIGRPGMAKAYPMNLDETAAASGLFNGTYVGPSASGIENAGENPVAPAVPLVTLSNAPGEVMTQREKSNGGEFRLYAISFGLPESWAPHFKVSFAPLNLKILEVIKDAVTGEMVMQDPSQEHQILTTSFKAGETSPDETESEHAQRMEDMKDETYEGGFNKGLAYTGLDMVTGLGDIVAGGAKVIGRGFLTRAYDFKMHVQEALGQDTTQTAQLLADVEEKQMEVAEQIITLERFLSDLDISFPGMARKVSWAYITGDWDKLRGTALFGSETHRMLFYMACEALAEASKEWEHGTPGQRGYIAGRIVGEILAFVIPEAAAGRIATKIQILEHLRETKLFQAASRTVLELKAAALALTRMCFVAGTPIKTGEGQRVLIEDVKAGMEVWSRDELSGKECLKRVMEVFITHPTEICQLTYEVSKESGHSQKVESETLGVTAQHPFWVCNHEPPGFIAAGDLRVGDMLFVGEGMTAVVGGIGMIHSPPNQTFTTYNFEVEGFHTYFAGAAGVWVHNMSKSPCDEVFEAIQLLKNDLNMPAWEAFVVAVQKLGKGRNSSIFGWAADETMRDLLKLPLPDRVAQWPSHREVRRVMRNVNGKADDIAISDLVLGQIDVPPWVVAERLDLAKVKSFMLQSHHGIPKEVQDWLKMIKDVDACPAYLTTMVEHQGAGVGLHQRMAENLGKAISDSHGPWLLNMGRPPLSDTQILKALADTYRDAGLTKFWDVCMVWKSAP